MKVKVTNHQDHRNLNTKVKVAKSKIKGGGNGLYALQRIPKDTVVCTYGGALIDCQDAKYLSPVYIANFENGKGFKVIGDDECGDLGHYANAVHPDFPEIKQNARFHMMSKQYLPNNRGVFNVMARQDIEEGEEIIVNYSDGYWVTMKLWNSTPHPEKPLTTLARDERAKRRGVVAAP